MIRQLLTGVGVLVLVTGCGFHANRYTWSGDEAQIAQAHAECLREMQKEYVSVVAAKKVLKTAVPRSWVPVAV